MARFDHPQARRALARRRGRPPALAPERSLVVLLASVSFETGLVHLREQNRGLALDAFRLVHRLIPEGPPLDPARYPPEVVKAFEAARKAPGGTARLEASSTFDGVALYLDGERIGATPLALEIAAGPHYLVAPAAGFAAARLAASTPRPDDRVALDLDLARLSRRRARAGRSRSGPAPRPAAGNCAALRARRHHRRRSTRSWSSATAKAASPPRSTSAPATGSAWPARSTATSASCSAWSCRRRSPARPISTARRPPPAPVAWYQRPWGVLSIGGAVVLTVVGVVALTSLSEPDPLDRNAVLSPFGDM